MSALSDYKKGVMIGVAEAKAMRPRERAKAFDAKPLPAGVWAALGLAPGARFVPTDWVAAGVLDGFRRVMHYAPAYEYLLVEPVDNGVTQTHE
jgi:hypothetical protein